MSIKSQIESLLFISTKPLSLKKITEVSGGKKDEVKKAIAELAEEYNHKDKGINIQKIGASYQMVTSSENAKMIGEYLKEEITGELTPASLETLTVIAYRGPITKTELELIRGVNCSVILRNLLIRGLIEQKHDKKLLVDKYQVSFDFLQHLGLTEISKLPEYEKLNSDENLQKLLNPDQDQQLPLKKEK